MPVRAVRRPLLWTAPAVAAACVAALLTAVPAQARPAAAPKAPRPPKPTSTLSQATTSRIQRALIRNGTAELIVSLNHGASLSAATAAAKARRVAIGHTFSSLHTFTVRVPAARVAAETAALKAQPGVLSVRSAVARYPMDVPNDTLYNSDQSAYLDAVHAPDAWTTTKSTPSVTIAVIDSGVDVTNPDLSGGKVTATYNAVTGTSDASDTFGHGTFVAGVAAATTNNNLGIAGAGYNASIMAVKVQAADGTFSVTDEIAGIQYAVAHHANVINISLGGTQFDQTEADAIAAAQAAGVVVVAAAGNDGLHGDPAEYPAAYPGVIGVGAVDTTFEQRTDFSEYGNWVSVAAPGVSIEGTVPDAGSDLFPTAHVDYGMGDGTSFASPIVAGEVALLAALRPGASVAQLRAAVINSAHPLPGQGLGAGLVDFAGAIAHLPPAGTPTITAPSSAPVSGAVTLTATSSAGRVQFAVDGHNVGGQVAVSGGTASTTWSSFGQPNGSHTVTAFDCTAAGECSTTPGTAAFTLTNTAPTVTSPAAGALMWGMFTFSATSSGGGVAFLVDGVRRAFVGSAPYSAMTTATGLTVGNHTLQAVQCDATGAKCQGPASAGQRLVTNSLSVTMRGASPVTISPNGDRVHDATTITYSLANTQSVQAWVFSSTGARIRGPLNLGSLAAGTHTWGYQGINNSGQVVPNGTYTVWITTARGSAKGAVSTQIAIDTTPPRFLTLSAPQIFYPVRDGYGDTFTVSGSQTKAVRMQLVIDDSTGAHHVNLLSQAKAPGAFGMTWDGRDSAGHFVRAGNYSWYLVATDSAGNHAQTGRHSIVASAHHLVARTTTVDMSGAAFFQQDSGAISDTCATVGPLGTVGVELTSSCGFGAFAGVAAWRFTLPTEIRYESMQLSVWLTKNTASDLLEFTYDSDASLELLSEVSPPFVNNSVAVVTFDPVPAAGRVLQDRVVEPMVVLDSNGIVDMTHARLTLTYDALG